MKPESLLKATILSHGINFTERALQLAKKYNAKGQNLCYNLPHAENMLTRPQELSLINRDDGYETVVSCVAPHSFRQPLLLDATEDFFYFPEDSEKIFNNVEINVVREPAYYRHVLSNGVLAKEYVSACGFDELNILPWSGCAISHHCAFCGIESVNSIHRCNKKLTAHEISNTSEMWTQHENTYLSVLKEALKIAKGDSIYARHLHAIMISGNLSDDLLDYESEIYSRISKVTYDIIKDKTPEGFVAVIEPPPSDTMLHLMFESKISTVVFNMEVASEPWATRYCPGKNHLGENYILERLMAALPIFGHGHVWTNFVLGLEPLSKLTEQCEKLAMQGIVPSANVFHCDLGSRLRDQEPPSVAQIIDFFKALGKIYHRYNLSPFYCEKALRTSLSNEAYVGRLYDD